MIDRIFVSHIEATRVEYHIQCDPSQIARYVLCPGDHGRAKLIADHFENAEMVSSTRGYVVYSGIYEGIFMTAIGTGMGGPTVGIALEELAHMGADTFVRVGSCGVFQPWQATGDVIILSGTVREGGTSLAYLPINFPAVPTYAVLSHLNAAAQHLGLPVTVGIGVAGDAFYAPQTPEQLTRWELYGKAGLVSIEMESDTLFIIGQYRRWRTGAINASDGTAAEIKPAAERSKFLQGQENVIRIALLAMQEIAKSDTPS
jgi:uridine phosphorylase